MFCWLFLKINLDLYKLCYDIYYNINLSLDVPFGVVLTLTLSQQMAPFHKFTLTRCAIDTLFTLQSILGLIVQVWSAGDAILIGKENRENIRSYNSLFNKVIHTLLV